MFILGSLIISVVSATILYILLNRLSDDAASLETKEVPEHIWDDLKSAIPEADYNYLRATSSYMASSPEDMISRLNYVGAVHDPSDPKQVRLTILELRLAELDAKFEIAKKKIPTDAHVIWLSLSAVATVSSLVALIFYLLQGGLQTS